MTKYIVDVELPDNINRMSMKEYINDAIKTMCKSYRPPGSYDSQDPGDPLFNIDASTVKVSYYISKKE